MTKTLLSIYRYFQSHKAVFYSVLIGTTAIFAFFASQITLIEDITSLLPKTENSSDAAIGFGDVKIKDKLIIQVFTKSGNVRNSGRMVQSMDSLMTKLQRADSATGYMENAFYRLDTDDLMNAFYYATSALPCHVCPDHLNTLDKYLNNNAIEEFSRERLPEEFAISDLGGFTLVDGYVFSPDSTVVMSFVSPSFNTTSETLVSDKFVAMIDRVCEEFRGENPDLEVVYHGLAVNSCYNSRQIKKDMLWTTLIPLLLICVLISVCFTNKRTVPLLLLPVVYGSLFGLAVVFLIKGTMSLIALGVSALVLGVAISYCLHMVTHQKYVSNVELVIGEEAKGVFLGCLTTVGAFVALLFTSSELLRDFGLFAALAMVGTTFFALVFLPQFLSEEHNRRNETAFAIIDRINTYPIDRNKPAVAAIAIVCIVGLIASPKVKFDSNLSSIGYSEDRVLLSEKIYNEKVNQGKFSQFYASHASTLDSAILINRTVCSKLDSLKEKGLVHSYSGPGMLLLTEAEQRENIYAWNRFWTPSKIKKTEALLKKSIDKYGWNTDGIDILETFRLMMESDYEPACFPESGALPDGLMCNFVEQNESGWMVFTTVIAEKDNINAVSDVVTGGNTLVLDPYYYTGDMVEIVHSDFKIVLLISSIFVFLVLLVSFKSLVTTLIAYMPMILSWYIVEGIMAISGLQFNLVNIMISTFVFGIGVDYSIFVMQGLQQRAKYHSYRLLTFHKTAILFSALSLLLVTASLLFASHPAIYSIGISTIIGMTATISLTYALEPVVFKLCLKNELLKREMMHFI